MTEQPDAPLELEESFEERIAALEAQKRGSRWSNVKIALVTMLVATGVAVAVTAYWVPRTERHARKVAIEQSQKTQAAAAKKAAEISYNNQLASCRRGLSVRNALRTDALAIRKGARAEFKFFDTAIRRAKAQSKDPAVSAATSASALAALQVYGTLQASLPVNLTIPPKPPKCLDVIKNPNAPAPQHHS